MMSDQSKKINILNNVMREKSLYLLSIPLALVAIFSFFFFEYKHDGGVCLENIAVHKIEATDKLNDDVADRFKCPEDYLDYEQYVEDVARDYYAYKEKNPNSSEEDYLSARLNKLVKYGCDKTLDSATNAS